MKILTQILRIFLILIDSIWFFVSARFMFAMRWDVTSRIFEDWGFFQIIAPQYLELLLLLSSIGVLIGYSHKTRHPFIIAAILNLLALLIMFLVGSSM